MFRTKQLIALSKREVVETLKVVPPFLQEALEKFINNGSGWKLDQVEAVWIDIAAYEPIAGNSYMLLPKELRNKKCIVYPINKDDNLCFLWCILASQTTIKHHPERISW